MFTQKQIKGIVFCGIGLLSLIFSIVLFTDRGGYYFGFMYLLAALTFATIGLFDLVTFPANQVRRAPQQNYVPQNQAPYNNPQNQAPYNPQNNNFNNTNM